MGRYQLDFDGYRRRLDCDEYRKRRRDVPSDIGTLLDLAHSIELADYKEYLDADYYRR